MIIIINYPIQQSIPLVWGKFIAAPHFSPQGSTVSLRIKLAVRSVFMVFTFAGPGNDMHKLVILQL